MNAVFSSHEISLIQRALKTWLIICVDVESELLSAAANHFNREALHTVEIRAHGKLVDMTTDS